MEDFDRSILVKAPDLGNQIFMKILTNFFIIISSIFWIWAFLIYLIFKQIIYFISVLLIGSLAVYGFYSIFDAGVDNQRKVYFSVALISLILQIPVYFHKRRQKQKELAIWLQEFIISHRKPIRAIASNSKYIFTSSDDKTIRVWNKLNNFKLQNVLITSSIGAVVEIQATEERLYDTLVRHQGSRLTGQPLPGVWNIQNEIFFEGRVKIQQVEDESKYKQIFKELKHQTVNLFTVSISSARQDRHFLYKSTAKRIVVIDNTNFTIVRSIMHNKIAKGMKVPLLYPNGKFLSDGTYLYVAIKRHSASKIDHTKRQKLFSIDVDPPDKYSISVTHYLSVLDINNKFKQIANYHYFIENYEESYTREYGESQKGSPSRGPFLNGVVQLISNNNQIFTITKTRSKNLHLGVIHKNDGKISTHDLGRKKYVAGYADEKYLYFVNEEKGKTTVDVIEIKTMERIRSLNDHRKKITSVHSDETYLFTGSHDGIVQIYLIKNNFELL